MSAGHTPGPWETSHDGHGGIYVGDKNGRQVGFVSLRSEQEANARLIAAAPELLEALRDLLADYDGSIEPGESALIDKARAAIAKVKGGA